MKIDKKYLVKYEGLNFNKFLDLCLKHNIQLTDIKVLSNKEIIFKVCSSQYKKVLLKNKNSWYKLTIEKKLGFEKIKEMFFKRIGLAVGLVCVIIFCVIFSKTTLNYNITGCETIDKQQVISAVENFGVRFGKINKFNNDDLENYLITNIPNISLVSVMTKGNTLCVNIKEKTQSEVDTYDYITAPYTMLITHIEVVSGTPLVKVGDVVLKGKELVAPYTVGLNNEKLPCKAMANIKADVWFCGNVDFKINDTQLIRTGQKITHSFLMYNNTTILSKQKDINFEYYEVEQTQAKIKNFFLPLTFKTIKYYECEYKTITNSLLENQESLLQQSKEIALKNVPSGFAVVEETQKIINVDNNLYKFQTYLKSTLEINNAS